MPPKPPVFLAERLAALLRVNPDLYNLAVEMKIVDPDWLENPTPIDHSRWTVETLRRFAERAAERSPSSIKALGMNALQLLSWDLSFNRVAGRGTPEADVSVLFIDLQGFTQYTAEEGDSAALKLLEEHNRMTGPIVRRFDGRIVKRIGDGMMIVFEDPIKSVLGGVELISADHPLPLRAGAHAGRAMVSDYDVFGNVVNVASRIANQAVGGQMLISSELHDVVADRAGLSFVGPKNLLLKGIEQEVEVWQVAAAGR